MTSRQVNEKNSYIMQISHKEQINYKSAIHYNGWLGKPKKMPKTQPD